MKQMPFISLVVGVHVLFIGLQIHKSSYITKCSYQKQKYEQTKEQLTHRKQELLHQLHALRNNTHIKQFAVSQLQMSPVKLSQIRKYHADS